MCLISVAYRASARFPLAVAANRDERHARASAPAAWWEDAPDVVGGRDLVAGGSWLAADRTGRVAAVTNRRPAGLSEAERSRGRLVADFLTAGARAGTFADEALAAKAHYGPFNLVLVDAAGVEAVSSLGERLRLTQGAQSFGNTGFDDAWPKLATASAAVERALAAEDPVTALFDVLAMRADEPGTGSAPGRGPDRENIFVVGPEFGTRCSTVFLVDALGHARFVERRFDAAANVTGETRLEFETQPLSAAR